MFYCLTTSKGQHVKYIGIHPRIATDNLTTSSFHNLRSLETHVMSIDLAEIFDLSNGGTFNVSGHGKIDWAWHKKTKIEGVAPYETNTLTMTLPPLPPKPKMATKLTSDCAGSRYTETKSAEAVCAMLSAVAGNEAMFGNAERFYQYFRTYDTKVRQTVAKRFYAVSDECAGKSRVSTTYCSNALNLCKTDYISVTQGTQITPCDLYWTFPTLT
jgi:deuterolysin